MKNPTLISLVIALALVFANTSCACAPVDLSSSAPAHHHAHMEGAESVKPPCAHEGCEGCDSLLQNCATPEISAAVKDRDHRPAGPQNADGPDLLVAFIDTGQITSTLAVRSGQPPTAEAPARRYDTPVQRKDQLIE